jgi:hypothetical protein
MKSMRWILPGLALAALLGNGCILVSGQIFAKFQLPNPFLISSANAFQREFVDLTTVKEYSDNADKLKGLSDIAVVGKFKNLSGPAVSVQIWITPGNTNLADVNAIKAGASLLWGPGSIGAATAEHDIGWNESAKLFNAVGKNVLIDQVLHGGKFTLYFLGNASNELEVDDGAVLLTIDAGK